MQYRTQHVSGDVLVEGLLEGNRSVIRRLMVLGRCPIAVAALLLCVIVPGVCVLSMLYFFGKGGVPSAGYRHSVTVQNESRASIRMTLRSDEILSVIGAGHAATGDPMTKSRHTVTIPPGGEIRIAGAAGRNDGVFGSKLVKYSLKVVESPSGKIGGVWSSDLRLGQGEWVLQITEAGGLTNMQIRRMVDEQTSDP